MKMKEYKARGIYNIGFIDPDKVHIDVLKDKPDETEENLLRFLREQNYCDLILFLYNFK